MPTHTRTFFTYRTPFGPLTLVSSGNSLVRVALGEIQVPGEMKPSLVTNSAATELLEYFAGKRRAFNVPLKLEGSEFQKKVWQAICDIPYGQTRTPAEVAETLGAPRSFRAVSRAANANPLVVIVPAHRVVPASGFEHSAGSSAQLRKAFRELERRFA